ncbi:MAG TPA: protein kinase, partial [Thermoanaerobaculia bacterium]
MPFESGDSLGRYTIERRLGSGAMGDVHLARDPRIDRRVALKTLRIATVRPGEMESMGERLLREARAAGRLIHPHIVTLFDAGEHDGLLYLAFEYVAGSDLAARLRTGPPLALGEALRIAGETCEGLAHAHAAGLVHRDVKPSNLLLTPEGRVKISDFGIAKLSGESQELTVSGTVMGSPHYLSPEQVRGEPLDGRSDLFSLGIVLYEMIAGRRPFAGETLTTLVYQILHQEAPALPPLRAGLSPAVPRLLAWFLAKDRDERVPDGRTAADAIARLAAELPRELLALPAVSHDEGTLLLDEEAMGSLRTLPPPPAVGSGQAGAATVPPPPGSMAAGAAGAAGAGGGSVAPLAAPAASGATTPARGGVASGQPPASSVLAGGTVGAGWTAPVAGGGPAAVVAPASATPFVPPAPPAGAAAGVVPSGSYAIPGAGARRTRWLLAAALVTGFVLLGGLATAVLLLWPSDEPTSAQAPAPGETVAPVGEPTPGGGIAPSVAGAPGEGDGGDHRGAVAAPPAADLAASPTPAIPPPSPLVEGSATAPTSGSS